MEPKSFPPELGSVEAIQNFVKAKVSALDPDDAKLFKIDLVIEEIVVNIVKYGLNTVEKGVIDIKVGMIGKGAVLEIWDNGPEFNPMTRNDPDVTAGIENRRPGGLGIFLVKQIAKEMSYERRDNKNRVKLWLDL